MVEGLLLGGLLLGGLLIGVDSLVKAGFATDGLSADAAKKEPARYLGCSADGVV